MISYIIQVSISWIFFYGLYHLFLRKETFFNINRYYLMGSLILSLFIPQIGEILGHWFNASPADAGSVIYMISEAPMVIENVMSSETSALSFLEWSLLLTYLAGIGIVGTRFLLGLIRIFRLYSSGTKKDKGTFVLVETNGVHLPFSFFQYVFISKKIPLQKHIEKIIRHELTHVEKLHSLDILLIEALHIFFWFNPVLLLYKKAIRQSHEYQADASVLTGTDIKNYGQILLGQSSSGLEVALANHFFNSQIKNRITMMYRKKSTRSALIKYLAAVPVLLFMAFLFSNATQVENDVLTDSHESTIATYSSDTIPPPGEEIFTVAEQMPRFPGCEDMNGSDAEKENCAKKKMLEYIYQNLKYPREAKDNDVQGTVVVQFVINKDGSVGNIHVLRDIGSGCGEAVTQIVNSMNNMPENWTPGVQRGKKVNVVYTLPVNFKLTDKKADEQEEKIESKINVNKDVETRVKSKLPEEGLQPLYILDGKEVDPDPMNDLKPDDIETINVLKGDSAAEKYGEKGKNGVVEITTKNGKETIKLEADKIIIANDNHDINADAVEYDPEKDPLYVLDGEEIEKDVMKSLDPDNIKSINVLKDDSAIEKYGDKGENGVIEITTKKKDSNPDMVYTQVERMPRFPGCENAELSEKEKEECSKKELLTFVYKNIKYPKEARAAGVEGMSVVQFTVMKDGSVGDISIKRSIGGGTDEAVLSVMDQMVLMEEKWTPGMQYGKPVNVRYTLPIRFKLDGPAKKTHPVKKQKEEKMEKEKAQTKSQLDQITVVGYGQNQKMDELVKEDFLSSMKVFPNPAQEEVNIEVNGPKSPLEIRVHDLSGKLLHRQMINDFNGSYKGVLRSENFINTQAIISFIQDGKVQSQQIIFSK